MLDAVPAARGSATGPAVGNRGAAVTVWPDDGAPLPTAARPALALVLVPTGQGTGADGSPGSGSAAGEAPGPTWVFPFDRPLPPRAGDNQALAVNTIDGAVAYDVSFALVWADENTAVQRNEAYALARCTGCRTVAVAFQVVLVLGSVDVVVPQNTAVAVNYLCVECVTYALATQLVVSVPGPLSDEGFRELAAIWEELRSFGGQIADVPLSELRARLTEYEVRILDVVRQHAGDPGSTAEEPGSVPAEGSGSVPDTGPAGGEPTSSGTEERTDGGETTTATPSPGDPGTEVPTRTPGAEEQSSTSGPATTTAPESTAEPTSTATASPSG